MMHDDLMILTIIMFQGEPYLHVVNNLMVVPGLTKYTARVLMFDPRSKVVTRVRDLVHRQHWVLGAYIGQYKHREINLYRLFTISEADKVLSLSVPACKSVSSRRLSLWCLVTGHCLRVLTIAGAIGGFPVLRHPWAFLPSASRGLEIWDLREEQGKRVRCIGTNVFSYLIKNQFLFVLNKHSQMKIYRVGEVTRGETKFDTLWTREGGEFGEIEIEVYLLFYI